MCEVANNVCNASAILIDPEFDEQDNFEVRFICQIRLFPEVSCNSDSSCHLIIRREIIQIHLKSLTHFF